jgi:hypothetical protein
MMRAIVALGVAALLGVAASIGQAADQPSSPACAEPRVEVSTCQQMTDETARLACLAKADAQRECLPEKNPSSPDETPASERSAVGPTRDAACETLLRNEKGEYSAGKCVCKEPMTGVWRCTLGN